MWVLIIIMMKTGQHPLGAVQTQEFNTQQNCEYARQVVVDSNRGLNTKNLKAVCVIK